MRTMLSILDWNSIQQGENEGLRKEKEKYRYYSKAKGEMREKIKNGCFSIRSMETPIGMLGNRQEKNHGMGDPPTEEDIDGVELEELDQLDDYFDAMLNFDENDSDSGDEIDNNE